ncbi:MAG: hypothetical protein CMF99_00305 [Candidatus Marinimicrobia bacterium]|nr:hypothetical protein [Candidatus Neomarinimicrobiota bacterium]
MLPNNFVLLGHLIFTSIMTGVIWVIQIVHYPSFHFIEKELYTAFQKFHMNKISIIVIPIMLAELITGMMLFLDKSSKSPFLIVSFVILVLIWLITGVFFSKAHNELMTGYQELVVNQLVVMNWIRTLLWTLRLLLLTCFVYLHFSR